MNCEANRNLKVMASPCCIKIPFSFYELHDAYMMAVHTSIAGWQFMQPLQDSRITIRRNRGKSLKCCQKVEKLRFQFYWNYRREFSIVGCISGLMFILAKYARSEFASLIGAQVEQNLQIVLTRTKQRNSRRDRLSFDKIAWRRCCYFCFVAFGFVVDWLLPLVCLRFI